MHRDGTPDEFDRDREEWEDRQQLARQTLDLRVAHRAVAFALCCASLECAGGLYPEELICDAHNSEALQLMEPLLTHVRTLRAVLKGVAGDERHSCLLCGMLGEHRPQCQAASLLAQATDA